MTHTVVIIYMNLSQDRIEVWIRQVLGSQLWRFSRGTIRRHRLQGAVGAGFSRCESVFPGNNIWNLGLVYNVHLHPVKLPVYRHTPAHTISLRSETTYSLCIALTTVAHRVYKAPWDSLPSNIRKAFMSVMTRNVTVLLSNQLFSVCSASG